MYGRAYLGGAHEDEFVNACLYQRLARWRSARHNGHQPRGSAASLQSRFDDGLEVHRGPACVLRGLWCMHALLLARQSTSVVPLPTWGLLSGVNINNSIVKAVLLMLRRAQGAQRKQHNTIAGNIIAIASVRYHALLQQAPMGAGRFCVVVAALQSDEGTVPKCQLCIGFAVG